MNVGVLLTVVLAIVGAIGFAYMKGAEAPLEELRSIRELANVQAQENRKRSKEVADAQQAFVRSWTALRDRARDERRGLLERIEGSAAAVSGVCPESGSSGDAGDAGLEQPDPPLTAEEAGNAFAAGQELQAALELCHSELRQCASICRRRE